jgi:hypothetical protein
MRAPGWELHDIQGDDDVLLLPGTEPDVKTRFHEIRNARTMLHGDLYITDPRGVRYTWDRPGMNWVPASASGGAEWAPGQRVWVHRNLHRLDFSVTNPGTGRVIRNPDGTLGVPDVTLTGVTFRIQSAGLAAARRNESRNVCAYAAGTLTAVRTDPDVTGWRRVTFNPFRLEFDTFTCEGQPILQAPEVVFAGDAGWIRPATTEPG